MAFELPPGVTLYLARHAETVANAEGRFEAPVGTPLTERGFVQARMLGEILAAELVGQTPRFVSSPLPRARITMQIALQALRLPAAFDTDPRLAEIGHGAWGGLPYDATRAVDPETYDDRLQDKWNVPAPGGESYAMAAARTLSWLENVEATTFAVSHGAILRIVRYLISGLTWEEIADTDAPQGCMFAFQGRDMRLLEHSGPSNPAV